MSLRLFVAAASLIACPLGVPDRSAAQNGIDNASSSDRTVFPVPFGPGEEAIYQLKLGILSVGEGRLAVAGVDTVRGRATYRLEMGIAGGGGLVDDKYQSWLDIQTLSSRRFIRDIHELNYDSRRVFEIYPEKRRWERADADQQGNSASTQVLDDLSWVYFIRTLPLVVGETYTFNRYFKEEGNPVQVKVLRKESKEVPAGRFNTIVVQPIIRTDGLFGEGGSAEIYLSDDEHRHIVYLRSEIPIVGSLTLHLREVRVGTLLHRSSPAERRDVSAPAARPRG